MEFMGIDLHTDCFNHCTFNEGTKKKVGTYSIDKESLEKFYKILTPETYVIVESTTNAFKFTELIQNKVKDVFISNTYSMKLISFTNKKTDKVDAEKLARVLKMQIMSGEEQIKRVTLPPPIIQDLRALFSTYKLLGKQRTQLKNRIHSLLKQNLFPFNKVMIFNNKMRDKILNISDSRELKFQLMILFKELDNLDETIILLKKEIEIAGSPYMKEIDILTSMQGISVFTAIAIISDIIDVKRFSNSKNFASYLRSAPKVESSNEKTLIKSTNKQGRKLTIALLYQSLNHFINSNRAIEHWYDKLSEYKKVGKVRMGTCRRFITVIYQLLKKEEYYRFMDTKNHDRKMHDYEVLLRKNRINISKLKEVS
ncbi:IS110 family transposase [Thiospirochaeta perfilievii]|uniref:IS110 family transposase n=1 Tax=Thiospirochaeta perfilievii TaxID=252967 RepID=A0A5C1QB48_9SPIO|nr:IS110 family transposase [Thiospirochaeta perfilievii]QEN04089.1 IS110 family transposase [Thiospirochaeta perfilievii]